MTEPTTIDTRREPLHLPVLPLRDVVVFPGVTMPILAGRPPSLRAIDAAYNAPDKLIFTVLQRSNSEEIDTSALFVTGSIARIDQQQRGLAGTQLLITGLRRGHAVRYEETAGMILATIVEAEELQPDSPEDPAFVALHRELRQRAADLGERSGLPKDAVEQVLRSVTEPGRFTDLVAGYLELGSPQRQQLLETLSIEERLRLVLTHVQRQINVLDAQETIKSKVQAEIGDRQREIFLREQMKAIQDELGEGEGGTELEELRAKLDALDLSEDVRKEVNREFSRLSRMGREAMEAQVIRTYLETITELPWNKRSEEQIDLKHAEKVLEEDHYGLEDVKDRVLEFLAVRQLQLQLRDDTGEGEAAKSDEENGQPLTARPEAVDKSDSTSLAAMPESRRGPILLFVGPPGVGKTSIAQSIARATGRKYHRISLGGIRDEADIRGHRRTYVAAMPGRIIQGLKQVGTKNPVFVLDEVDKLAVSFQGNPASALLEVLDPAQNDTFTDHYLGVPFDLSEVLFIATANFVQNIPAPLLDRMEMVEFSGYTEQEKKTIARQYLVPRQLTENGLTTGQLEITDEALEELISRYTREAGVRQLERVIGSLARKVARRIAAAEVERTIVERGHVPDLLGRPKVHPEHAAERDQVGVATGMFYTPVGGDIMFVEVSKMRGKGELILTGQLGDVMKESARAAWSYARSHADILGIDRPGFEQDLHIHVPAGAIPKDGPSAGVTIASAVVSALSERPVRHDVAMTGEITLSGRVLPIGGVKEKVLGAVRAGISDIVLPKDNEADLEDLHPEVRDRIRVQLVEDLGQVLAFTLRDASLQNGRLVFRDSAGETLDLGGPAH
ncbi:MAG TPA: endopeptidase La [Thermoanaerobaculia bacterium]|nr:endopeptidase La [Thermoanaerobaculia bacterium]